MNVILHKKILRKLEFVLFAVKIMCFASGKIYKDGRMLPCILFENINATYQKVNGENFQECWDNDSVFNIINKNKVNNKKCDLCGFSEICNGGCPADRIKKYGVNYNKDIICKK